MRAALFSTLWCSLWLSGCAYYGDMHNQSHPLTPADLSTHHVYPKPAKPVYSQQWWQQFHDPQLNQLITVALSDSPTLEVSKARIRQAQYLADAAGTTLWPSVGFSGYVQRQRFSEFGIVPPPFNGNTYNIGTLALNFNYEFDFWGKNRQALKARLNTELATEAELAQSQLVIAAAVANTYFQLCNYHQQVRIAQENWNAGKQILQIAAVRSQKGVNSEIPVQTIQANVKATEQLLEQYRQAELLANHQLASLMGKNPFSTSIEVGKLNFRAHPIALPSNLPANLLAARPDIYASKMRVEAAANEINVAKARFFPNINLSALYSYQGVGLEHLFQSASQNNAITGAIDLPIFDAGLRRANLGVKLAEYDKAVNDYNNTILSALREVADQVSILQTVKAQLKAQNSAFDATQRNYKLYNLRYNQGIADYVSVLESKQLVLQQQAVQVNLQTQQLQAVVLMLKALGGHDSINQG